MITFPDPTEDTASFVEEVCLLIGCLAMDVLFFALASSSVNVFTESLPSNGYTRHIIILKELSVTAQDLG
jgi:hypothetical protein